MASYNKFTPAIENLFEGINAGTDSWVIKLATAVDQAAGTITEVANGNGYTTGGETLASMAVTQGATTKWDATDTAWTSATFSAYHAVIWDDTVATDDLIASIDFGGEQEVASGTFTIQWNAAGIITLA